MANREENIKKINDELEKLEDDELENVAGGINTNQQQIVRLLNNQNPELLPQIKNLQFYARD